MRAVVQRVASASVTVGGELRAECGRGLLVLLGIAEGDGDEHADRLARKVAHLRVFEDANGRLELSLLDVHGEALAVSQFTLIADTRKGSRPSFTGAARPEHAEPLYERFCGALRAEGVPVQTGVFGARMGVSLVNDGPVTVILES
jgi:D-tyrosyl-tRNA(Tyr) deacylase